MTPLLRRTATIGTAALGLSLALAGAVPSAFADTTDGAAPAASATPAIVAVDKFELAAAYSGIPADTLRTEESAGEIHVSDNGFILHLDGITTDGNSSSSNSNKKTAKAGEEEDVAAAGLAIPGSATAGSRPGAPVTIYLDFDGETLTNTSWNDDAGKDPLTFVAPAVGADETFRNDVWAVVAEDYAPFNVNVTTANPGTDALVKSSASDSTYGSHVIVTDSYDEVLPKAANTSGLAYVGGTGSDYLSGAFVFTRGLGDNPSARNVGNTASHESGHNFGLDHDGIAGSTTGQYYVPTAGLWAPTMGASFNVPISQWSNGSYAGATNTEADLTVITDRSSADARLVSLTLPNGDLYAGDGVCKVGDVDLKNLKPGDQLNVPNDAGQCDGNLVPLTLNFTYTDRADFAADEAGDSVAESKALENDGNFETAGVIGTPADVDVYAVVAGGGAFTATVNVAAIAPNLDSKLTLTDSKGAVLATNNPEAARVSEDVASGLDSSVTAIVPTGVYYLTVEGVGFGDPSTATPANSNGYSDYGSLGNYTLSGAALEFVAADVVINTPTQGAKVDGGSKVDVTGTATPDVTVTVAAGGKNVTTVADANGKWATSITANAFGNTEIVASQGFDSFALPQTASVTVTSPVTAPVITSPSNGTSIDSATPVISGNGIAGATVSVSVTDASGTITSAEAVVGADGKWAITLGALPAGAYTVTAVQTINGVTSGASAAVPFSVVVTSTTGTGNDGGVLAATGNDLFGSPFILLAAGLLLAGAVTMSLTIRRRRTLGQQS